MVSVIHWRRWGVPGVVVLGSMSLPCRLRGPEKPFLLSLLFSPRKQGMHLLVRAGHRGKVAARTSCMLRCCFIPSNEDLLLTHLFGKPTNKNRNGRNQEKQNSLPWTFYGPWSLIEWGVGGAGSKRTS